MTTRRRLAAAALLAAALLAPSSVLAAPGSAPAPSPPPPAQRSDPGAAADACAGASEESPVKVEVTALLPRAPSRLDQPFQLAGRVRNCGKESLTGLQVRLAVGGRIRTRGELQRAAEEPVVGRRRLTQAPASEQLAPGQTTPFDLRLLVRDLGVSRLGVYPVSVQARARYGRDAVRTPVGLAATFVPWFPDGAPAPNRVAWLWPLVDQPRRAPTEVMLDDVLETLVAPATDDRPAGRLHELLAAAREGSRGACDPPAGAPAGVPADPATPCRGEPVPMTYGVDPSLLYSIEAMTAPRGYSVRVGDEVVDRPASAAAARWLVELREAAQDSDVLALPFGDPDVVALSRAASGLRDEVEQLRKLGQAEARRLLYEPDSDRGPLRSVAWPPPGPLTPALDVLLGGEATSAVLDVRAVARASAARSRTPSARTELASITGPVTGLVVEDVLSRLVEGRAGPDQGARLAEQRFIAETAIIAAEAPSTSRTLVIAPRRMADVAPEVAAAAIADTGRLPWLCPVSLADVAQGRERCSGLPDAQGPVESEDRGVPGETDRPAERTGELSPEFVAELAEVRQASDQLTDNVLVAGTDEAARTRARLLRAAGRAASAAWRDQPLEGRRLLRLLAEDVERVRGSVRLVSEPVLLTGSSGVLQLVVTNELDQPVNVGVALDETSAARLSSTAAGLQVIPPRNATQIPVRVEPRTSGRFVVLATLVDAEGRPFGDPVRLDVRSTKYGRVALAVTGVAAAVLLVAAGARITRRALRRSGA